ncbi:MAG TPA: hypothetical protein VFY39_16610 [Gammaproteobacteria bacterium]|nr:hypothetical protein [Gammaproteobacteria bacterium]
MKYILALLAGLALGGAAAVVLLYFNPLIERKAEVLPRDSDLVLHYVVPGGDLLAFTHSGGLPLPFKPAGIGPLWESTVRTAALSSLTLAGADGRPAALASRLSMPSPATDLLTRGLLLDDYWLITVPGQGSLFVHSLNNFWPLLKDSALPVSLLGRSWRGPREYHPTLGPGPGGTAVVTGGTGQFAGRRGSALEQYRLNGYSRAHGVEELAGELALRLDAPSISGKRRADARNGEASITPPRPARRP